MRKTILTLAMTLMVALATVAAPTAPARAGSKPAAALTADSLQKASTIEMQQVRDKIDHALDDTLTGPGGAVARMGGDADLTPDDVRALSDQWAGVVENIAYGSMIAFLALIFIILLFRYLTRRRRYRVIERAIENNYPLDELSLGDVKRSAIYVQQPVVQAPPVAGAVPPQHDSVPVGKPMEGQRAASPVVIGNMVNWRALMPAIKWVGWGVLLVLFSIAIGNGGEDPFWPVGLALIVVGVSKGFILYKEQQALQQAWQRAQQRAAEPRRAAMGEGAPVPPPADEDYRDEDNNTYQPY